MNKSYYNAESNLIAKRLRQLRKERGFSQEELAAQLQLLGVDINQPLISKIERNRRFVKDYELACLCRQDSRLSAEEVRRLSSAYFLCRRRNEVNEMEATVQRKTLTMEDRKVLAEMWAAGERAAVIAVKLGVCPDTVYKELKRGYTGTLNELSRPAYDPARGQAEYQRRLRNRGRWRRDKEEHHGAEAET